MKTALHKIEELALLVAEDALRADTSPEDRREALKILNPHYTMLLKSKAKESATGDGFNFAEFGEINGESATTLGSRGGRVC